MKYFDVYKQSTNVGRKQLFARVPEEYAEQFDEHLFYNNVSRFSIQCSVVALMDLGLLIFHFISGANAAISFYTALICGKIALKAVLSYVFARMNLGAYNPRNLIHRHIDLILILVHVLAESALFLAGPQDLGALVRLCAVPFIVGGIPIIRQFRAFISLALVYLFFMLAISPSAYSSFIFPFISIYSLWAVAFLCSVFLSFTVYSWYVNNFVTSKEFEQANTALEAVNDSLESEVERRTSLLRTVNYISTELIGADASDFNLLLFRCMDIVGTTLEVDRVYIWRNEIVEGELYCSQIHEWSGGAEPQQGNELTVSVPFPDDWYPKLSKNECVNGIVSEFPEYEREHLQAQNIVSIIVVPVYIHNDFWGFVGFDDCKNERLFTEEEEAILRTVGLMFTTSLIRNEMTNDLMKAKDEALASSKSKTDFLANMSHEIRTPINAITGMSGLARRAESKSEVDRCLNRIDAASKQLLSIINDVLDMSKIEAGKIELADDAFELYQVLYNINSIIGVQANEKDIRLNSKFSPGLPEVVVGDDMRISQILINLLSNAVKFTPRGGDIEFTATLAESRDDGFDVIELVVKDNGIGIAPEQQEKLFGMFEQADRGISRRFGGTGLGLSITKNLVDLMQGVIEIESAPGDGSRFTVRIPLRRGNREMLGRGEGGAGGGENEFAGYTALLVEDIEINREIVTAILSSTGLTIDEAENGQIALDMINESPDRYDLVFMDLHMPVMDGYTATGEIRSSEHPHVVALPIIAMTANAFSEDVQKCIDAGMNAHVAKPVDFNELISTIRSVLSPEKNQ